MWLCRIRDDLDILGTAHGVGSAPDQDFGAIRAALVCSLTLRVTDVLMDLQQALENCFEGRKRE